MTCASYLPLPAFRIFFARILAQQVQVVCPPRQRIKDLSVTPPEYQRCASDLFSAPVKTASKTDKRRYTALDGKGDSRRSKTGRSCGGVPAHSAGACQKANCAI